MEGSYFNAGCSHIRQGLLAVAAAIVYHRAEGKNKEAVVKASAFLEKAWNEK